MEDLIVFVFHYRCREGGKVKTKRGVMFHRTASVRDGAKFHSCISTVVLFHSQWEPITNEMLIPSLISDAIVAITIMMIRSRLDPVVSIAPSTDGFPWEERENPGQRGFFSVCSLCSIIPEALSFGIRSELSSCDHGRRVTSGYSFLRIPVCVHGENGHRLTNVEQIVELWSRVLRANDPGHDRSDGIWHPCPLNHSQIVPDTLSSPREILAGDRTVPVMWWYTHFICHMRYGSSSTPEAYRHREYQSWFLSMRSHLNPHPAVRSWQLITCGDARSFTWPGVASGWDLPSSGRPWDGSPLNSSHGLTLFTRFSWSQWFRWPCATITNGN